MQARWNSNGHELFYLTLQGVLMSVPIAESTAETVVAGPATPLFTAHVGAVPVTPTQAADIVACLRARIAEWT